MQGGSGVSLTNVFNLIKDVQKKFKTREMEKKELEVRIFSFQSYRLLISAFNHSLYSGSRILRGLAKCL